MEDITIKVLDGSDELKGTMLQLRKNHSTPYYICRNTGLEIIDKWDELSAFKKTSNINKKSDVLLFINSNSRNPLFINRVQRVQVVTKERFTFKVSQLFSRFKNRKTIAYNY